MTEHLPECRLSEPCDIDITDHGFCSMQVEEQFFCIHCMGECICKRLRSCERRVIATSVQRVEALPPHHGSYAGWLMADEAIAAIKGDQP
jgi:hypothetical protein